LYLVLGKFPLEKRVKRKFVTLVHNKNTYLVKWQVTSVTKGSAHRVLEEDNICNTKEINLSLISDILVIFTVVTCSKVRMHSTARLLMSLGAIWCIHITSREPETEKLALKSQKWSTQYPLCDETEIN
jgi:hypothetical protein